MGVVRIFSGAVRDVGEVLFPRVCWVEGEEVAGPGGLSEGGQMAVGVLASQNYCRRCGLTTGLFAHNDFRDRCGRCGERNVGVIRTARVGTFSEPLVGLVHRLKFGRSWEVARVLGPYLQRAILQVAEEGGVAVDVLVPVPLHWTRRARRGFNQAEELAREAARLGGWRVKSALRRVRSTSAQAQIGSPTSRRENLRGAFRCPLTRSLAGKHVWLVDDVTTTGATIHAAATALRRLKGNLRPASINAAVICVTDHGSPPAQIEIVG